jgi:hypothetical protein
MAPLNKPIMTPPPVAPVVETPFAGIGDTPEVKAPTRDAEIERITQADPQLPIDPPAVTKAVKCPKCKSGTVAVYGQCIACYDKLKPVEKRKLLLMARVTGVNAHEYAADAMKTWKLELELINSGHWKGPLKFTASKRPLSSISTM